MVKSRSSRESIFSNATPTATEAPTAVSLAVTSPLAVEIVFVSDAVTMLMLSDALMVEPVPT